MQKLFQNKSITQKIIIAIVFVILFNFTSPCVVQAAGDFSFIFNALSWCFVRLTDVIQWLMLFCLTGDVTNVMGHAEWEGKPANKDHWSFELLSGIVTKPTIEWPQRHILAPDDVFTGNILFK